MTISSGRGRALVLKVQIGRIVAGVIDAGLPPGLKQRRDVLLGDRMIAPAPAGMIDRIPNVDHDERGIGRQDWQSAYWFSRGMFLAGGGSGTLAR